MSIKGYKFIWERCEMDDSKTQQIIDYIKLNYIPKDKLLSVKELVRYGGCDWDTAERIYKAQIERV